MSYDITHGRRPALTDNDVANLEKIAKLRGHIGMLRREVKAARDELLRYEHRAPNPGYPMRVLMILTRALELEAP